MTFTLALDGLTDAELVDRIESGDPRAAARFWVRHWPTALSAARGLVEPAEVPGLAAEALVGTLAAIRVGSGPADHAAVFVIDAVHELGGDEFLGSNLSAVSYPDLFPSRTLAAAFAALRVEDQQLLWASLADAVPDDELALQLGTTPAALAGLTEALLASLQQAYIARHLEFAAQDACHLTHAQLAAAVSGPETVFPTETWVHLSECVVCTEAFHELAHSPVDLAPLLGAASFPGAVPAAPVVPVAAAVPAAAPTEVLEVAAEDPVLESPPAEEPPALSIFEPAIGPVAVTALDQESEAPHTAREPAPPVVSTDEAASTSHASDRDRKPWIFIVAAAVLAGVIALGVGVLNGSDPTSAADGTSTGTPTSSDTGGTPSDDPTSTFSDDPTSAAAHPTARPSTFTPTAAPSKTPAADLSPTEAPTKPKPTRSPTHVTPRPTPTPSTGPTASPTPSPCNVVQHLLGVC